MKYLKQTEELLFDPSFFRLATIWNEGFVMLDHDLYAGRAITEAAFRVGIKEWNNLCKSVGVKRIYGGYSVSFVDYVRQNIQDIINSEWNRFNKETKELNGKALERTIKEFLDEVVHVRAAVPLKPYLEPVQACIFDALDSIAVHYKHSVPSASKSQLEMNEHPQRTKLKWRGGAASLCALFLDLRAEKMKKSEDKYLSVGDAQLIQFIVDNFEFLGDDNEVEEVAESSIKRYIDGKPIARRIRLDFTGITK